jgi:hypothetical protein
MSAVTPHDDRNDARGIGMGVALALVFWAVVALVLS